MRIVDDSFAQAVPVFFLDDLAVLCGDTIPLVSPHILFSAEASVFVVVSALDCSNLDSRN